MHTIIYPGGFWQSGGYYSQLPEVESGPCQGNRLRQPPGVAASSAIPHLHPATLPSPDLHDAALSTLGSPHAGSAGVNTQFPNPSGTPLPNASAGSLPPFLALFSIQDCTVGKDTERGAT